MLKKHIRRYFLLYNRWLYIAVWMMVLIMSVPLFSLMLILHAQHNIQLNVLHEKIGLNQVIAGLSIGVLIAIISMMLALLLYKTVKDNENVLGVLRGIGYKKKTVILSFMPLLLSLTLPIVLGYLISISLEGALFAFMNQHLSITLQKSNHSWLALVNVVIVFIVVVVLSIVTILLFIRKNPVHMINGTKPSNQTIRRFSYLNVFNGIKGIRKLQLKYVFSQGFVFMLTLFTGFAMGVQLVLGLSIYEFPNKLVSGLSTQFTYKYDVRFEKPIKADLEQAGLEQDYVGYSFKPAMLQFDSQVGEVALVILENHESELQKLISLKFYNHNINANGMLNHGVAISKWLANKYDIAQGDTFSIRMEDEAYDMAVAAIHSGLQGNELYMSKRYYEKMTSNRLTKVDGFYTNDEKWQEHFKKPVKSVVNQQEAVHAVQKSVEQYKLISIVFLMISILVGVLLFSISLFMVLRNGETNILLLKALGYTNRQIYTIVIEGYLLVLLFGMVTARPFMSFLTAILFNNLSRSSTFYLPINATLVHITYLSLSLILAFSIISLFYFRKISKMNNFSLLMQK